MEKLPRQKYTKEFREQAVKLVSEQALTVPEAAKRLSMSGQTLSNWVFKARQGKLAGMDGNRKPVTDLEAENSKLKRELAEARMERDILKKATVGSTGQRNTIYSNLDLKGGGYGTNGTTRAFCIPEGRAVAKMEIRTVFERHRSCARQACCVRALCNFVKWRDRASSSSSFSSGTHTG